MNEQWRAANSYRFGEWEFVPALGEVSWSGEVVARLGETESETLLLLIAAHPLPASVRAVVRAMAKRGAYWHPDTVKVIISRLRAKLGAALIRTTGRGYVFVPEVAMDGPRGATVAGLPGG